MDVSVLLPNEDVAARLALLFGVAGFKKESDQACVFDYSTFNVVAPCDDTSSRDTLIQLLMPLANDMNSNSQCKKTDGNRPQWVGTFVSCESCTERKSSPSTCKVCFLRSIFGHRDNAFAGAFPVTMVFAACLFGGYWPLDKWQSSVRSSLPGMNENLARGFKVDKINADTESDGPPPGPPPKITDESQFSQAVQQSSEAIQHEEVQGEEVSRRPETRSRANEQVSRASNVQHEQVQGEEVNILAPPATVPRRPGTRSRANEQASRASHVQHEEVQGEEVHALAVPATPATIAVSATTATFAVPATTATLAVPATTATLAVSATPAPKPKTEVKDSDLKYAETIKKGFIPHLKTIIETYPEVMSKLQGVFNSCFASDNVKNKITILREEEKIQLLRFQYDGSGTGSQTSPNNHHHGSKSKSEEDEDVVVVNELYVKVSQMQLMYAVSDGLNPFYPASVEVAFAFALLLFMKENYCGDTTAIWKEMCCLYKKQKPETTKQSVQKDQIKAIYELTKLMCTSSTLRDAASYLERSDKPIEDIFDVLVDETKTSYACEILGLLKGAMGLPANYTFTQLPKFNPIICHLNFLGSERYI